MRPTDYRELKRRVQRVKRIWYYEKLNKKEGQNEHNILRQGTTGQTGGEGR